MSRFTLHGYENNDPVAVRLYKRHRLRGKQYFGYEKAPKSCACKSIRTSLIPFCTTCAYVQQYAYSSRGNLRRLLSFRHD